jgi:hypothetical protein
VSFSNIFIVFWYNPPKNMLFHKIFAKISLASFSYFGTIHPKICCFTKYLQKIAGPCFFLKFSIAKNMKKKKKKRFGLW